MYHDINPNADLEGIHIFNFSSGKGTISNKNGMFRLSVSIGDTLSVSALQYEKATAAVRFEHFVSKKIRIELSDNTNLLDEVFLTNRTLSGFLNLDAQNIEAKPLYDANFFGIPAPKGPPPTAEERKLYTATTGGGIIPVDPIINAISGRTKMLKEHIQAQKANAAIEKLKNMFPPVFFSEELGIPEEMLYDFLFFCETDPEFNATVKNNKINISKFLTDKSIEYKILKEETE